MAAGGAGSSGAKPGKGSVQESKKAVLLGVFSKEGPKGDEGWRQQGENPQGPKKAKKKPAERWSICGNSNWRKTEKKNTPKSRWSRVRGGRCPETIIAIRGGDNIISWAKMYLRMKKRGKETFGHGEAKEEASRNKLLGGTKAGLGFRRFSVLTVELLQDNS